MPGMTPRAGFALRAGAVGASLLVTLVAGMAVDRTGEPVKEVPESLPSLVAPSVSPRAVPGLGQVLAVVGLEAGEGGCGGSDSAIDEEVAGRLAAGLPGLELVRARGCVTGARLPVEAGQTALLRVEVDRQERTASLVVADVEVPVRPSGPPGGGQAGQEEPVVASGAAGRGGSW